MGYDSLSIKVSELFGIVWTAYAIIVIIRGGGVDDRGHFVGRAGGMMRIHGTLEMKEKWVF